LVLFPFFLKVLEGLNSKLPLVVLNLFLESNGYIEVFVRVKLKARSMHCFLILADQMFDEKPPIRVSILIRSIPSGLKFGEILRFSNTNQDVISFVKLPS
jgi:hypothetical protein